MDQSPADHIGVGSGEESENGSGAREAACVLSYMQTRSLFLTNSRSLVNKMDKIRLRIMPRHTEITTETRLDNNAPDTATEPHNNWCIMGDALFPRFGVSGG